MKKIYTSQNLDFLRIYKSSNLRSTYLAKRIGMFAFFFFIIAFLSPLDMKAQAPVGPEFHGAWRFDHAVAQEKHVYDEELTTRTVPLSELHQNDNFSNIPTYFHFTENKFLTYISTASGPLKVFVSIMEEDEVEFRNAMYAGIDFNDEEDLETLDIDSQPLVGTYQNFKLEGNTLSMQYSYDFGPNKHSINSIGTITIYYKKQQ